MTKPTDAVKCRGVLMAPTINCAQEDVLRDLHKSIVCDLQFSYFVEKCDMISLFWLGFRILLFRNSKDLGFVMAVGAHMAHQLDWLTTLEINRPLSRQGRAEPAFNLHKPTPILYRSS